MEIIYLIQLNIRYGKWETGHIDWDSFEQWKHGDYFITLMSWPCFEQGGGQPFKVPEFFTWILFQITAFSQGPYPVLGVTCHLPRKCLACPFTTCTWYFKENRPILLSGKLWLSGIFLCLWGIVLVALDDGPAEVVLAFTVCASSVSWSSEGFFLSFAPF